MKIINVPKRRRKKGEVPAVVFVGNIILGIDNEQISDTEFRELIRKTLPLLEKPHFDFFATLEQKEKAKKYYIKNN